MQATATLQGLLGQARLHARVEDLKRTKGAPPWAERVVVNDQIVGTLRPTGAVPSIRLAITPPGEYHRHDREPGTGPFDR